MSGTKANISSKVNNFFHTRIGSVIAISTIFGLGYAVGIFQQNIIHINENTKFENEHMQILIDIKQKHYVEIIELNRKISILEIQNEKQKNKK